MTAFPRVSKTRHFCWRSTVAPALLGSGGLYRLILTAGQSALAAAEGTPFACDSAPSRGLPRSVGVPAEN